MKSLVWQGPRRMEIVESPVPDPAAGEVLIRVERVGICGSELSGYLGQNSLRKPPLVMGHEFAGDVAAAGTNVTGITQGDFVVVNPLLTCGDCTYCRAGRENLCVARTLVGAHRAGAFAEFVTVPAAACTLLSNEAARRWAFLIEPLACAVRAVAHARQAGADSLLVLGSGMIGLCCAAVAKRAGVASVLATDLHPERRAAARAWGADHALDPRTEDFAAAVGEAGDSLGVDAAIDCVGTAATRQTCVERVRPGGRVVLVGLHQAEARFDGNDLVRREITLTGSFAYTRSDFARAAELAGCDDFFPPGAWLETRPLEAGSAAFEDLVEGRAGAAKIALIL